MMAMIELLLEEALVGPLAVLEFPALELLLFRPPLVRLLLLRRQVASGVDDVEVVLDVGGGVLERDPLGVLLAPFVERGADWLGRFEAGDGVAPVAAEVVDRLFADEHLELVNAVLACE